jgi:hypothetical protein
MNRVLVFVAVWFGAMFLALRVEKIEMGHAICGAWGCGPPASALLAMHLFWLAAFLPPLIFAMATYRLPWRPIGWLLVICSAAALLGLGVWDYINFKNVYEQGFVWQRYLFYLATLVSVPVVQTLLLGIVAAMFGRLTNGKGEQLAQAATEQTLLSVAGSCQKTVVD